MPLANHYWPVCLLLSGSLLVLSCTGTKSEVQVQNSVVIAVDYSKSFVPLKAEDGRALKLVGKAVAEVATDEWQSATAIIWRRIQSASLQDTPPCGVIEYAPRLVQKKGQINRKEDLIVIMEECVEGLIRQSAKADQMANLTDISGAVVSAVEDQRSTGGEKVLILFSDFIETQAQGTKPSSVRLNGQRVVLLHRPAKSDETSAETYLRRIHSWEEKFLSSGASNVCSFPL